MAFDDEGKTQVVSRGETPSTFNFILWTLAASPANSASISKDTPCSSNVTRSKFNLWWKKGACGGFMFLQESFSEFLSLSTDLERR